VFEKALSSLLALFLALHVSPVTSKFPARSI